MMQRRRKGQPQMSEVEALITDLMPMQEKSVAWSRDARRASTEIRKLADVDYGKSLRKCVSRAQLHSIIKDARRAIWPHLNKEPLRLGTTAEFSARCSSLGIEIRSAAMPSTTGLALLGFYVRKTGLSSGKPLICVNTAHHPAAVGATFVHEMGHHLTSEIFGVKDESASFLMYTGYSEHLAQPAELAADIMVSLGIYPQQEALRMLTIPQGDRLTPGKSDQKGGSAVLEYFAKQYGLSFNSSMSVSQKFQYLAGLVHYTKLRQALRDEFDI